MKPVSMTLHGKSLFDFYNGDRTAEIILRRDDGFEQILPISVFFRSQAEFLPGEMEAINLCKGIVLDIGAGSGIHSLVLKSIDNSNLSIRIISARKSTKKEIKQYQGK